MKTRTDIRRHIHSKTIFTGCAYTEKYRNGTVAACVQPSPISFQIFLAEGKAVHRLT